MYGRFRCIYNIIQEVLDLRLSFSVGLVWLWHSLYFRSAYLKSNSDLVNPIGIPNSWVSYIQHTSMKDKDFAIFIQFFCWRRQKRLISFDEPLVASNRTSHLTFHSQHELARITKAHWYKSNCFWEISTLFRFSEIFYNLQRQNTTRTYLLKMTLRFCFFFISACKQTVRIFSQFWKCHDNSWTICCRIIDIALLATSLNVCIFLLLSVEKTLW